MLKHVLPQPLPAGKNKYRSVCRKCQVTKTPDSRTDYKGCPDQLPKYFHQHLNGCKLKKYNDEYTTNYINDFLHEYLCVMVYTVLMESV